MKKKFIINTGYFSYLFLWIRSFKAKILNHARIMDQCNYLYLYHFANLKSKKKEKKIKVVKRLKDIKRNQKMLDLARLKVTLRDLKT